MDNNEIELAAIVFASTVKQNKQHISKNKSDEKISHWWGQNYE